MRKDIIMAPQGCGKGPLDGFSRNHPQAEFFLESYDIDAVILIHVPDEIVMALARRLCPRCNLDYNLIRHRPAVENACDVCQGELSLRSDDTEEALGARLAEYHEKIEPILEFFRTKELVLRVEGAQSAEDVQADILQWLAVDPEQGQSRSRYFCDQTSGVCSSSSRTSPIWRLAKRCCGRMFWMPLKVAPSGI